MKALSHNALRFSLPDEEVAVKRNELMVAESACLTNVWNVSSGQAEVTGGMGSIETGVSVEMCAVRSGGSGEVVATSASIR